jgi:hypothetical protein
MMKFGLALFFIVFVAPLWAHHAAEGIVSDEIWAMIDDNLVAVDSPHLDLDFLDIMGSMSIGQDPDTGSTLLISYAEIDPADIGIYEDLIAELMEDPDLGFQIPSGSTSNGTAWSLMLDIVELPTGETVILLVEPVGATTQSEQGSPNQKGMP